MAVPKTTACAVIVLCLLSLGSLGEATRFHGLRRALAFFLNNKNNNNNNGAPCTNSTCPFGDECDFFFEGFPNSVVPTFNLTGYPFYTPLGAPFGRLPVRIRSKPGYPNSTWTRFSIWGTGNGVTTNSVNTSKIKWGCTTKTQFYGWKNETAPPQNVVKFKPFNRDGAPPLSAFVPNCVKLPITKFKVNNNTKTIYLEGNQNSNIFPLSRRCIIFRITA